MKKLFKVCTLILSLMFVLSFFALAACDNGGTGGTGGTGGGETPPPAHTHTFATTWSSDAENHWYAATCDHKTEKKDLAAHTFVGNTCSVCGYEKEVTRTAKCDNFCPICGKCIDLLYCTEDTEKCSDAAAHKHRFEAEEAAFTEGSWFPDINKADDGTEYVQGMNGNISGGLTFTFTSDKAFVGSLRICAASGSGKSIFTDSMTTLVNSEFAEFKTLNGAGKGKSVFEVMSLGEFNFVAGENTIEFIVTTTNGKNMDYIEIWTDSDAKLEFKYVDNADHVKEETLAKKYPDGYVTPSERNKG